MFFRKYYLKIRLYLYSIRGILNAVAITLMSTILLYSFINFFIFEKVILGKANYDEVHKKCESAIRYYNIAYFYYSINHFSQGNKAIFMKIPYKKAICFIKENKKNEAIKTMVTFLGATQQENGVFSRETADFTRQYLIGFYFYNNNYSLAYKEFNNLITIYRIIGYSNNEMADVLRICADIYYQQKNYDKALDLYQKAYSLISDEKYKDYTIYAKIVNRIASFEVENNADANAIDLYKSSIEILQTSGKQQNELTAEMLVNLAAIYDKDEKSTDKAITCYEEAIEIIKTLPPTSELKQNIRTYLTTLKGLYDLDTKNTAKSREIDAELLKQERFSFF